jgi:hypothetical protein
MRLDPFYIDTGKLRIPEPSKPVEEMTPRALRSYLRRLEAAKRWEQERFVIGMGKSRYSLTLISGLILIILLSQTFAPKPLLTGTLFVILVGLVSAAFIVNLAFLYGRKLKIEVKSRK